MIINLHGFNSAGNNNTRDQLRAYFGGITRVLSPTYSVHNFTRGMQELTELLEREYGGKVDEALMLVGSSTGAVFAESLAACYPARVVAINPVTDPGILRGALGRNRNYRTGVEYEFGERDLESFAAAKTHWRVPRLVLVERDDPVIDHARTRAYYRGHARYVEYPGDSHRFTYWEQGLAQMGAFYRD